MLFLPLPKALSSKRLQGAYEPLQFQRRDDVAGRKPSVYSFSNKLITP